MQLESLKMQNFRQFKDVEVDFAQGGDGRNVTIIIGQNGAGKTTIEQAFFWCLYGITPSFNDKTLINRDVEHDMVPMKPETVKVTMNLIHNGKKYMLIRSQDYTKQYGGNVKMESVEFNIAYTDEFGKQNFLEPDQRMAKVQEILPQALSRYFFFDGERIEEMGKEISGNKKVAGFENAVRGLLGLDAMMNAINHFSPSRKSSVISLYNNSFDAGSDKELQNLLNDLEKKREELDGIEERIKVLKEDIDKANTLKEHKVDELRTYSEGLTLQQKKETLQQEIDLAEESLHAAIADAMKSFNRDIRSFLSMPLIDRVTDFLATQNLKDAELPHVQKDTLDFLVKRGTCICGTDLKPGSDAYQKIMELYDFVWPKSIATIAKDFKNDCIDRVNETDSGSMYDDIAAKVKEENRNQTTILKKEDELSNITKSITDSDVKEKVDEINNVIDECTKKIKKDDKDKDDLLYKRAQVKNQIDNDESKRSQISAASEKNKMTEKCLTYAKRIYEELNKKYTEEETKVRDRLQDTINNIFEDIYNGELHLQIAENYHITVRDTRYESGVETSSGQSIAVIFAFIMALIQLAKENGADNNELLAHEVYPLVMDAPLSLFDKTRIDTVCRQLPKIAEQVVIFIKDTDGELAKSKMAEYIGKEYTFDKRSEFDTRLI